MVTFHAYSSHNSFVCRENNLLCFLNEQDISVKLMFFQLSCRIKFSFELWSLYYITVDDFCIARRKALRRVLGLPHNLHCYLLSSSPTFLMRLLNAHHTSLSLVFSPPLTSFSQSLGTVFYTKNTVQYSAEMYFSICCRYNCSLESSKSRSRPRPLTNTFYTQWFQANFTVSEVNSAMSFIIGDFVIEGKS